MQKKYKLAILFWILIVIISFIDVYNSKLGTEMTRDIIENPEVKEAFLEERENILRQTDGGELSSLHRKTNRMGFWTAFIFRSLVVLPLYILSARICKDEGILKLVFVAGTSFYFGIVVKMVMDYYFEYSIYTEVIK